LARSPSTIELLLCKIDTLRCGKQFVNEPHALLVTVTGAGLSEGFMVNSDTVSCWSAARWTVACALCVVALVWFFGGFETTALAVVPN
jgi:hypothetical protein